MKDAAPCSVVVVDHVENLLKETEKGLKEECKRRGVKAFLSFFLFFFFISIQQSQSFFVC